METYPNLKSTLNALSHDLLMSSSKSVHLWLQLTARRHCLRAAFIGVTASSSRLPIR